MINSNLGTKRWIIIIITAIIFGFVGGILGLIFIKDNPLVSAMGGTIFAVISYIVVQGIFDYQDNNK